MQTLGNQELLHTSSRRRLYLFALPLGVLVLAFGFWLGQGNLNQLDRIAHPILVTFFIIMMLVIWRSSINLKLIESVLLSGLLLYFNAVLAYTLSFPKGVNHGAEVGILGCWSLVIYTMFYWTLGSKRGLKICLAYSALTALMCVTVLTFTYRNNPDPIFLFYLVQIWVANSLLVYIMWLFANSIEQRSYQVARMTDVAHTDELTGLANRRFIDQKLSDCLTAFQSGNLGFSIILLDIDHFKIVNDEFGHNAGDAVLKQMANLLKIGLREGDSLGRWGGEEFIIVLPNTPSEQAYNLAERLRQSTCSYTFRTVVELTSSFGISSVCEGDNLQSLVARADAALYKAKSAGRNCVKAA